MWGVLRTAASRQAMLSVISLVLGKRSIARRCRPHPHRRNVSTKRRFVLRQPSASFCAKKRSSSRATSFEVPLPVPVTVPGPGPVSPAAGSPG